MRIPDEYQGPLRYHRSYQSTDERFEELILETLTEKVEVSGEAVSLHLMFRDHDERKIRSCSYIDDESLYEALDWFHEVQEGTLVQARIGKPEERPSFDMPSYED